MAKLLQGVSWLDQPHWLVQLYLITQLKTSLDTNLELDNLILVKFWSGATQTRVIQHQSDQCQCMNMMNDDIRNQTWSTWSHPNPKST